MQLSDEGLALIEGFEGWRDKLPDGRFTAYQDTYDGHLDKPTIGPGCTEGVRMGLVWTREECSAAFRKEMAKHEAAINRMVTVEISQHQFDALVSLSYNVGSGAVERSTALKKLNAGDKFAAAEAFKRFNRGPGGGVVKGLVARRAKEAAFFLTPDPDAPIEMPQTVTASPAPISPATAAVAASATVGTASQLIATPIPPVPSSVTDSLTNISLWQSVVDQASGVLTTVASAPIVSCVIAAACGVMWFWPNLSKKLGWTS